MLRLENVYAETGCRPVMVGHSFGGLLAYMTIARYQERAARVAAGVLYATAPFQGSSPKVHGARSAPRSVHVYLQHVWRTRGAQTRLPVANKRNACRPHGGR